MNILLHIYAVHAFPAATDKTSPPSSSSPQSHRMNSIHHHRGPKAAHDEESFADEVADGKPVVNGHANGNGNGSINGNLSDRERRRIRDAEEFELDALISDDDEGDVGGKKWNGRV